MEEKRIVYTCDECGDVSFSKFQPCDICGLDLCKICATEFYVGVDVVKQSSDYMMCYTNSIKTENVRVCPTCVLDDDELRRKLINKVLEFDLDEFR